MKKLGKLFAAYGKAFKPIMPDPLSPPYDRGVKSKKALREFEKILKQELKDAKDAK